jgi:hypothetical protein
MSISCAVFSVGYGVARERTMPWIFADQLEKRTKRRTGKKMEER